MVNEKGSDSSQEKFATAQTMLEAQERIHIHFDPRSENVLLPNHLKQQANQVLEFGFTLPLPMQDFLINKQGIGASLSFNRVGHFCWIPWDKVFCITFSGTQIGKMWEQDAPKDIKKSKNKLELKLIKGSKVEDSKPNKEQNYLRLVK